MIHPRLDEFERLSKTHRFIPVYTRILGDSLTPVLVYQKLRQRSPYTYLLESVQQGEKLGRYSFVGIEPAMIMKSEHGTTLLEDGQGKSWTLDPNPFKALIEAMEKAPVAKLDGLNFHGGWTGFFGYDNIRHIERIPDSNPDDLGLPDALFMLPKTVILFDHLYQSITLIEHVEAGGKDAWQKGIERIESILETLSQSMTPQMVRIEDADQAKEPEFTANMTQAEYQAVVEKAKHYIHEGDIFQVVLSQRFSMPYDKDPFSVYRFLRHINPSPYLFFLSFPDFQVAGSSPEILVKRQGESVVLRPIAGTRPRGKTAEEDQALAQDLLNDAKETAEHMMLVDLGRNDLGRFCRFGTVKPTRFKYIENYSHVMHIATNLEGKIDPKVGNDEILMSCFPAGTLSGAPKVRAMEIIDELEISKRGFYSGCVLNIDANQDFDACINIRSVVLKQGQAHIQAGAGIVADSEPEKEYNECLNKAKAVIKAVDLANKSG